MEFAPLIISGVLIALMILDRQLTRYRTRKAYEQCLQATYLRVPGLVARLRCELELAQQSMEKLPPELRVPVLAAVNDAKCKVNLLEAASHSQGRELGEVVTLLAEAMTAVARAHAVSQGQTVSPGVLKPGGCTKAVGSAEAQKRIM
ncbi:MAG: hypothetical protein HY711_08250 [Candidatus Melainabacteria bacterium]|nr:hypothetical protein [Candidatus Melainabacteria bacterium]